MTINQIIKNLNSAIQDLLDKESDNLKRGLSELNISTHLAIHLQPYFPEYDVDPEYNGDIDKPNDRKALEIARNRIKEVGRRFNIDDSYYSYPHC